MKLTGEQKYDALKNLSKKAPLQIAKAANEKNNMSERVQMLALSGVVQSIAEIFDILDIADVKEG